MPKQINGIRMILSTNDIGYLQRSINETQPKAYSKLTQMHNRLKWKTKQNFRRKYKRKPMVPKTRWKNILIHYTKVMIDKIF